MKFFDLYGAPIEEDAEDAIRLNIKGDIDTTD